MTIYDTIISFWWLSLPYFRYYWYLTVYSGLRLYTFSLLSQLESINHSKKWPRSFEMSVGYYQYEFRFEILIGNWKSKCKCLQFCSGFFQYSIHKSFKGADANVLKCASKSICWIFLRLYSIVVTVALTGVTLNRKLAGDSIDLVVSIQICTDPISIQKQTKFEDVTNSWALNLNYLSGEYLFKCATFRRHNNRRRRIICKLYQIN